MSFPWEEFDPLKGRRLEILNPAGELVGAVWRPPALTDARLVELYDWLLRLQVADQVAVSLQRAGRLGTYAPTLGQEAANIGAGAALAPEDWLVPSFREMGAMLLKGVPLRLVYLYWMGCEWGSHFPPEVRVLPVCAPVGTQTLHGVGLAWAAKLKKEASAVLVCFGDGATSKGDFHEAMNFAGVYQLPCVFFCQNNQYAISVPRLRQTASPTLAQKAIAYGFPGLIVDGNDLLAVYTATAAALARARAGGGPSFIEAQTYRLGPHTTVDDPSRYRSDEEVRQQEQFEPLRRLRRYLRRQGLWSAEQEERRRQELENWAREEAREAEAMISYRLEDIFAYHYATLTPELQEQLAYLQRVVAARETAGRGQT